MPEYSDAPEVRAIAKDIIASHHRHLLNATIRYVFRDEAAKKGSKVILGTARKIGGLNAFLASSHLDMNEAEDFFVIEIAADEWQHLDHKQRAALVDHELMHCDVDEDGKLKMVPHDLEEFTSIVRRHGLWKEDVRDFAHEVQRALPLEMEVSLK